MMVSKSASENSGQASGRHGVRRREKAYEGLRRFLILQDIRPGQRLREAEWAEKLGVNRMALREAFARLAAEGLIVPGPKIGYVVPELTPDDLREIGEARFIIEAGAIDLIVQAPGDLRTRLATLQEINEEMDRLGKAQLVLGSVECDRRFHETLVAASRNRRLVRLYRQAPLPMIHDWILQEDQWLRAHDNDIAEHKAVLAALAKRDADKARQLLREHLGLALTSTATRSRR
ncbi:MAG TPA: GntR family transcriptional regulator [Tepidisphaeraceae bacterium]|nr:GntR family transcriptional regulator [Tepidisphaeraceae bacterium]